MKQKYKKTEKKTKKKIKLWKKILIILIILLLAFGAWFYYKTQKNGGGLSGMLATVVGHDENTRKNLPEFKILLMGISTDLEADLTDTIMVASYNPNTQKATILSIPRDTYTGKNPKRATASQKINALYNIANGPESTLEAVNEITGLDIEYYAVVKTEALISLVDAIGGVEFDVPRDMKYDDPTQNLHINLKKGVQVLDGDKAEQLLRYRHGNNGESYSLEYGDNDFGRMRTQREFISAVLKQTLKPENIFKIGELLDIAHKNVETNVDLNVAKDYIPYAVEFSTENLISDVLPVTVPDVKETNNVSIAVVNEKETAKLIQELFCDRDNPEENVEDSENGEDETNMSNTTDSSSSNTSNSETANIKVEILNGTGEQENLQIAKQKLQQLGYRNIKEGNTNATSKTTIINKKGVNNALLEQIKESIGNAIISNSLSSSSSVDITIVLGKDF